MHVKCIQSVKRKRNSIVGFKHGIQLYLIDTNNLMSICVFFMKYVLVGSPNRNCIVQNLISNTDNSFPLVEKVTGDHKKLYKTLIQSTRLCVKKIVCWWLSGEGMFVSFVIHSTLLWYTNTQTHSHATAMKRRRCSLKCVATNINTHNRHLANSISHMRPCLQRRKMCIKRWV